MNDETVGQQVKRRRVALGMSVRQLATEAHVDRARVSAIESDASNVREITSSRVLQTLDRLEHRYGMDDPDKIVNVLELPDGTRVTFTGSAEGVAEAAARFLRERQGK